MEIISLRKLLRFIWEKTHRVKYIKVQTPNLYNEYRYVPQWWFLWWHCSWQEIGYQYEVPIAYDNEADAWASHYWQMVALSLITHEEAKSKLEYYRKNDSIRQKKRELEKDF